MQLPEELQQALQEECANYPLPELRRAAERLMANYKEGRNSKRLFADRAGILAYLAIRMPATYAAAHRMLQECRSLEPHSLLDLGAGPGTASWAAAEMFPKIRSFTLVEASEPMAAVGRRFASRSFCGPLQQASWMCQSIEEPLPSADLAILSYLVSELQPREVERLLERLWSAGVDAVAILEPGTPAGYERILHARAWALSKGASLIAPCPHPLACPMQWPDWCHFPARVERSRLHKELKGGTLGYEDEKFSYIAFSKLPRPSPHARIVGQPLKASGVVKCSLCAEGRLEEMVISRKQEKYREARDAAWGDTWPPVF